MEKAKKTRSAAQKAADKRYRDAHRNEYGQIPVTLPIDEANESRAIMEKLKMRPADVWRKAIEELKKGNL